MTDAMTFEQWLEQASEMELREASEFRHHYPMEIKTLTVTFDEIQKRGIEEIREDESAWKSVTVCGCDPAFQNEYGSEDHEAPKLEPMDLDEMARQLGLLD